MKGLTPTRPFNYTQKRRHKASTMKKFSRIIHKGQARRKRQAENKRQEIELLGLEPRLFPDDYYDETKKLGQKVKRNYDTH